jgi:hypothetical protein
MRDDIILGTRVPAVKLGFLRNSEVASITTDELFASRKTAVLGTHGAFTPPTWSLRRRGRGDDGDSVDADESTEVSALWSPGETLLS